MRGRERYKAFFSDLDVRNPFKWRYSVSQKLCSSLTKIKPTQRERERKKRTMTLKSFIFIFLLYSSKVSGQGTNRYIVERERDEEAKQRKTERKGWRRTKRTKSICSRKRFSKRYNTSCSSRARCLRARISINSLR